MKRFVRTFTQETWELDVRPTLTNVIISRVSDAYQIEGTDHLGGWVVALDANTHTGSVFVTSENDMMASTKPMDPMVYNGGRVVFDTESGTITRHAAAS